MKRAIWPEYSPIFDLLPKDSSLNTMNTVYSDFDQIKSMSEGITYEKETNQFTVDFAKTDGESKEIIVE